MIRYPVLLDGEPGAFGVVFPDIPGCVAMGDTQEEALINAAAALRDFARITAETGGLLPSPTPMEKVKVPKDATLMNLPMVGVGAPAEAFDDWPDEVLQALSSGQEPLAVFRAFRGFTTAELALRSKISQATITGIEQGTSPARFDELKRLARALEVDVEFLA